MSHPQRRDTVTVAPKVSFGACGAGRVVRVHRAASTTPSHVIAASAVSSQVGVLVMRYTPR